MYVFIEVVTGGCRQKLMTFNTGLTMNIEEYDQRRTAVISALKHSKSHFVCLQEVWYAEDVYNIVTETSSVFPHSYSSLHKSSDQLDTSGPPCGMLDYVSYTTLICIHSKGCMSKTTYAEAIECGETECKFTDFLSQDCIICAMQSATTTWSLISKCLTSTMGMNAAGLLILSKQELTNTKTVNFYKDVKQLVPRKYLQVQADGIGTIICTHLTPNLGPIHYEPNLKATYNSWEEQNKNEGKVLVSVTSQNDKALIMGDLNCGPTLNGRSISGDFEDTYRYFIQNNFQSPYVDLIGICTWCRANPLLGSEYPENHILDHILVKGHTVIAAKRYYFKNMKDFGYPMSDHYAVQVTIDADQTNIVEENDDTGY